MLGPMQATVPSEVVLPLQEYLAHAKHPPPGTQQYDCTQGPLVVPGGVAVSYERGTPVHWWGLTRVSVLLELEGLAYSNYAHLA